MDLKLLGKTGIRVSALCFGTMSFGGAADEATAAAMYRRCREAGINFFDCANVYSAGVAEEILGRVIQGERNQLVLTTKVGFPMGDGINDQWVIPNSYSGKADVFVTIYNEKGEEVLNVNNYQNNWPSSSASFSRQNMVFYYKIRNTEKTLKQGTITVIR